MKRDMNRDIQALLFDLDGTLIDSMPHHHDAWVLWHQRHGLQMDHDAFFAATAGRSNAEILTDMFPAAGALEIEAMAHEKEMLYREIAAAKLQLIAGAQAYLQQARAAGLRLAVCTASTPENMALAFARYGIDGWVETVVSPADRSSEPGVEAQLRGKPHPDIFLEAARRLGVAAEHCVVFEDAPLGVEGARRAGMRCVALTTTLPAAEFTPYDNVVAVVADFDDPALLDVLSALNPKADHHA